MSNFDMPTDEEMLDFEMPSEEEMAEFDMPTDEEVPVTESVDDIMRKGRMAQAVTPTAQDFNPEVEGLEEGQMSALEAAAVHAAPSATLGLSDVLAGASGAAGGAIGKLGEDSLSEESVMKGLTPELQEKIKVDTKLQEELTGVTKEMTKDEGLLEDYYGAKKSERQRREKAMEDQPGASIAGMIGGGFLTPVPSNMLVNALEKAGKGASIVAKMLPATKGFSDAARIKNRAKAIEGMGSLAKKYNQLKKLATYKALKTGATEGAKAGAMMGATMGDAELLNGDVLDTFIEAGTGGLSGAVIGGAITGGMSAGGNLLNSFQSTKKLVKAYNYGKEGGILDERYIADEIENLSKSFIDDLGEVSAKLGASQDEIITNAKKMGTLIKTQEDVADALGILRNTSSKQFKGRSKNLISMLEEHLGESQEMRKIEDKLTKELTKIYQAEMGLDEAASRKLAVDQVKQTFRAKQSPTTVREGNVQASDVIDTPHDITMKVQERDFPVIDPETGLKVGTKTKISSTEVPTGSPEIRRGIDPTTGREYAGLKYGGKEKIYVGDKPNFVVNEVDGMTSIDDAITFRDELKDFTFLKAPEGFPEKAKQTATNLVQKISKEIDDAVAAGNKDIDLKGIRNKLNNYYNIVNKMDAGKAVGGQSYTANERLQKVGNFLGDWKDSAKPTSNLRIVMDELKQISPELARKYGKEIRDIRRLADMVSKGEGGETTLDKVRALVGAFLPNLYKVANKAGRIVGSTQGKGQAMRQAVSEVSKEAREGMAKNIAAQTRRAIDSTPEQLQQIIAKIEKTGNPAYQQYKNVLEKLGKEEGRKKAALLYGLMQQKDFRTLFGAMDEEEDEILD